jgi:hypothetical protein
MSRFTCISGCLFFLLLGFSGCQRLRYETSFKLEPGRSNTLTVEGPKKEQTVNVDVSAGETVDVEISLQKDQGKGKPLKRRSDVKSITETVQIPAGESFVIVVTSRSPKPTEVTVKAKSVD